MKNDRFDKAEHLLEVAYTLRSLAKQSLNQFISDSTQVAREPIYNEICFLPKKQDRTASAYALSACVRSVDQDFASLPFTDDLIKQQFNYIQHHVDSDIVHLGEEAENDEFQLLRYNFPFLISLAAYALKDRNDLIDGDLWLPKLAKLNYAIKRDIRSAATHFMPTNCSKTSPYLDFLFITAANDIEKCNPNLKDISVEVVKMLKLKVSLGQRACLSLQQLLSYHHAGMSQLCDPTGLVHTLVAAVESGTLPASSPLVQHVFDLLFSDYFKEGFFSLSKPALVERNSNFLLILSSTELLAVISEIFLVASLEHLEQAGVHMMKLVKSFQHTPVPWHSEHSHIANPPTIFVSAAAFVLAQNSIRRLSNILSELAREDLGVKHEIDNRDKLAKENLDERLQDQVNKYLINPRKSLGGVGVKAFSLVLYGPPGTSKTRATNIIAAKLDYDYLYLTQSNFLLNGIEGIEQAADSIFRRLHHLKDVVVVLDELEELFRAREVEKDRFSRTLTTAMLPRMQNLRDKKNVITIFLTNHVENVDTAITRHGRFDIIFCMMPPSANERRNIMKNLLAHLPNRDDIMNLLEEEDLFLDIGKSDRTFRFACYGDLERIAWRILSMHENNKDCFLERRDIKDILVRTKTEIDNNKEVMEQFEKKMQKIERLL